MKCCELIMLMVFDVANKLFRCLACCTNLTTQQCLTVGMAYKY